jgi:uncharacterized protein YaiI (UPF0178 family)
MPETRLTLWIDADACPGAIRAIVFKAATRLKIPTVLVANQSLAVPRSELFRMVTVPYGADIADNTIVMQMNPGDVVVTGDIPLAARVVEKKGIAIGPRGQVFDDSTVHGKLATRNLMEQFRAAGIQTSGPRPQSQKDVQTFANTLDRTLTKRMKQIK